MSEANAVPVLIAAADGAAWESRVVAAWASGRLGVRVVRRCLDVVELLAVAATGQARACLVSADLRRLDADAVDRLNAAGVSTVGVVPRGDGAAVDRLAAYGVTSTVPDDADPSVVAAVLLDAVRSDDAASGVPVSRTSDRGFADPAASASAPRTASTYVQEPVASREQPGSVIAVWGPTGAPGRTTVAVGLADELSRVGLSSMLIDADVYGGTVAAVFGLLDESPGLASACRQAGSSRLDGAALAAVSWQVTPSLRVLTGIPLASRWPELRAAAVEAVLDAARDAADFVVVDCGFSLETDEELSYDTMAPRRNGATLAVLDAADVVVAVGAADAVGMQRLVRGLTDLPDAGVDAPTWVVLNKVRGSAVPGDTGAELAAALQRFAGRTPAALLPMDQQALDDALARGRTLAEARPSSPLRLAIRELACGLAQVPVPERRGRRRAASRRS